MLPSFAVLQVEPAREEVVLTSLGSSFWLRVRINARARWWLYLILAALVVGLAWALLWMLGELVGLHASRFVLAVAALGIPAGTAATLLLDSARAPAGQALVPRKLVLRAQEVEVSPARGRPFTAEWRHYIVSAVESASAYTLRLGKDRPVSFVIAKARLSPQAEALVARWLHEHRYLS